MVTVYSNRHGWPRRFGLGEEGPTIEEIKQAAEKLLAKINQKEIPMVRAKFKLSEVTQYDYNNSRKYVFSAIQDKSTPENEQFTKYTPSGKLEIQVDNPAVHDAFQVGKFYYLDFTPAE